VSKTLNLLGDVNSHWIRRDGTTKAWGAANHSYGEFWAEKQRELTIRHGVHARCRSLRFHGNYRTRRVFVRIIAHKLHAWRVQRGSRGSDIDTVSVGADWLWSAWQKAADLGW
jgi:hypothetical protein